MRTLPRRAEIQDRKPPSGRKNLREVFSMKRTLQWSVLFTLLLCFILIPFMTQKAAAADYDLWVNGTQVTDENKADIPYEGTGKASYDDSTKTLTFENAVFTDSDVPVIQAQDDLIVTGQVQYTGTKGGILADKSLTIVGSDTNVNVTAPTAIITYVRVKAENSPLMPRPRSV